jgi:hypothetical protein
MNLRAIVAGAVTGYALCAVPVSAEPADGRQYIAIASGSNILSFALPSIH